MKKRVKKKDEQQWWRLTVSVFESVVFLALVSAKSSIKTSESESSYIYRSQVIPFSCRSLLPLVGLFYF